MNLQLFLLWSISLFIIDSSHKSVIWNLFLDEVVEDGQSASLVEDPRLLRLIHDPPEKLRASLDQEWFLFMESFVLYSKDVFGDDIVVYKDWELRHEIELSLNVFFLLRFLITIFHFFV